MAGEAGALADAELVHSRSEERERVGERDLDGGRGGRAAAVHAIQLGQHLHHRDAVDGQVERVLRDGARGREPGVGERTRPLAVEDFDRAAERRAARARQAHVGVEAGIAGDHARDPHLRPAGVRDAVAVSVGLVGVVDGRAVVARVAHAVVVGVGLVGVVGEPAVVHRVADAVEVAVDPGADAVVAGVADAVAVAVGLVGVGGIRAVVDGVADAVAVLVAAGRAPGAGVAVAVKIAVGLVGVVDRRAVVARVADAVAVAVGLVGVV